MDTSEFLTAFFAEKSPSTHILVWTLPDKDVKWFIDPAKAASHATAEKSNRKHCYFGVGTRLKPPGGAKRGDSDSVAELFGIWADIDVAGPNHKKNNLPPTVEDALSILESLPHEPSIVVHTGGGLQAYWLFDSHVPPSPQVLALVYGWQLQIQETAKTIGGWEVDSVHDAPRVMRIPGTWNIKSDPPVQSVVLSNNDVRYAPEDFMLWSQTPPTATPPEGELTFEFSPNDASPPFDKWEALKQLEPKAKLSWERRRKDMKDSSASGYDMSLAAFTVRAEWEDQEIVNLLLSSHRHHGEAPKGEKYYAFTVRKAREFYRQNEAQTAIEEHLLGRTDADEEPVEGDRADVLRTHISDRLGVRILHVYKYKGDPPTYRLEVDGGGIMVGESKCLLSQQSIRCAIADVAGRVIPTFASTVWSGICQALLDIREEVDIGEEATDRGSTKSWLNEYLDSRPPCEPTPEYLRSRYPLMKDKRIFIFIQHFRAWLHANYGDRVGPKILGRLLREIGAEPDTMAIKTESGRSTTTSCWKLPESMSHHIPEQKDRG